MEDCYPKQSWAASLRGFFHGECRPVLLRLLERSQGNKDVPDKLHKGLKLQTSTQDQSFLPTKSGQVDIGGPFGGSRRGQFEISRGSRCETATDSGRHSVQLLTMAPTPTKSGKQERRAINASPYTRRPATRAHQSNVREPMSPLMQDYKLKAPAIRRLLLAFEGSFGDSGAAAATATPRATARSLRGTPRKASLRLPQTIQTRATSSSFHSRMHLHHRPRRHPNHSRREQPTRKAGTTLPPLSISAPAAPRRQSKA